VVAQLLRDERRSDTNIALSLSLCVFFLKKRRQLHVLVGDALTLLRIAASLPACHGDRRGSRSVKSGSCDQANVVSHTKHADIDMVMCGVVRNKWLIVAARRTRNQRRLMRSGHMEGAHAHGLARGVAWRITTLLVMIPSDLTCSTSE
jgi:hypothetical protein